MSSGPPELSRIDIGDATIQYLDYGSCGPALILLHATGFLPWLWHPVAVPLAESHRVIAPCLYAHRTGDPRAGGVGWLTLAEDLKQMCIRLGVDRPYLVGHSMGAAIAVLAHAARGLASSGMVLIEPILLPPEAYRAPLPLEQHPLAAKAIRRRNHWPDRQAVWNDFSTKPFFQSWDREVLALYTDHGTRANDADGLTLVCPPRQEAALFIGGMQSDPWPQLLKIACPTMIVEGEISENRHWIDLQHAADVVPGCRYAEVPGAGHLVPMEKPAETALLIRSFFGSTASGA